MKIIILSVLFCNCLSCSFNHKEDKNIEELLKSGSYIETKAILYAKCVIGKQGDYCDRFGDWFYKFEDFKKAKEIWTNGCNKGNKNSCSSLSWFQYMHFDKKYGLEKFKKDCQKGVDKSCYLLESAVPNSISLDKKKEICLKDLGLNCYILLFNTKNAKLAYVINMINDSCKMGKSMSCKVLSDYYMDKKEKMNNYTKLACEAGLGKSCLDIGEVYLQSSKVKEAKIYIKKSCENGFFQGCMKLDEINGQSKNYNNKQIFKANCWKKVDLNSCLIYAGIIRGRDEKVRTLKYACDKGNIEGCLILAWKYYKNKEFKKTSKLFDELCKKDVKKACFNDLWLHSLDSKSGNEILQLEKYCDNSYHLACYIVSGIMAKKGKKDLAMDYLKKSLELGMRNFKHINSDPDLESIRNSKGFESLIETFKKKSPLGVINFKY